MSKTALKAAVNLGIQTIADELAKKYGRKGYGQLCKQWGVPFDEQAEKIFIAAFASGAHAALTTLSEDP